MNRSIFAATSINPPKTTNQCFLSLLAINRVFGTKFDFKSNHGRVLEYDPINNKYGIQLLDSMEQIGWFDPDDIDAVIR